MTAEELQQKCGLIGETFEIKEIVNTILQVAPTDLTILITGESGPGKEVIAKAIYLASKRSNQNLVSVNSGAIPEGIIESELFGHEKGSFTGASEMRKGYFELAHNGTIFLDEIGEMPISTQVKFLRILESGEFMRVGSSTTKKVDVRIIAATNKDLEQEVAQKEFRSDLFYRLRSVNIKIPPLRNRRDDIPLLMNFFSNEIAKKNYITFEGFSGEAYQLFKNTTWNGNIRELRNTLESIIVVEKGKKIDYEIAKKYISENDYENSSKNLPMVTGKTVEQAEREIFYRVLLDLKSEIIYLRNLIEENFGKDKDGKFLPIIKHKNESETETENKILSIEETINNTIAKLWNNSKNKMTIKQMAKILGISTRTLGNKLQELGLK